MEEQDLRVCPECEKKVPREDMLWTRDCHGIRFRLLCQDCYEEAMSYGYDGQYYNEWEECLDEEW